MLRRYSIGMRIRLFLCLCIAGSPAYADSPMTFRGIGLGDSMDQVKQKANQELGDIGQDPIAKRLGLLGLVSGGDPGREKGFCGWRGGRNRQDCIGVQFSFSHPSMGGKLQYMKVTQRFASGPDVKVLQSKLESAYGAPRALIKNRTEKTDFISSSTDTIMIWGGVSIPKSYSAFSDLPEDYKSIGGRFIVITIHDMQGEVSGYSLRIADTDVVLASAQIRQGEYENEEAQRQKLREASIRF